VDPWLPTAKHRGQMEMRRQDIHLEKWIKVETTNIVIAARPYLIDFHANIIASHLVRTTDYTFLLSSVADNTCLDHYHDEHGSIMPWMI
jgi:hypothetical protein